MPACPCSTVDAFSSTCGAQGPPAAPLATPKGAGNTAAASCCASYITTTTASCAALGRCEEVCARRPGSGHCFHNLNAPSTSTACQAAHKAPIVPPRGLWAGMHVRWSWLLGAATGMEPCSIHSSSSCHLACLQGQRHCHVALQTADALQASTAVAEAKLVVVGRRALPSKHCCAASCDVALGHAVLTLMLQ